MNFLITGGAGFIGGNFLLEMAPSHPQDRFVCLDALTYAGNRLTIQSLFSLPNFRFVRGNIGNRKLVDRLFQEERFDFVINFAAETHVDRACLYPDIFIKTNVLGTQVLLDACRKYGIRRFHQVSTDEVYGDLPLEAKDSFFSEASPIKPSSPYSASKAAADLLVLAYHRTFGLPVTLSRCSNNYGPYQYPEKLIPLMISKALNNEPLPVYGNGLNVRDWLYVADHCQAIDLIVRSGADGNVYNVGGHNEKSNLEIVHRILEATGKPSSLISFVKDRPGHDQRYAIDPQKIETLGWHPQTSFDKGISDTIGWYLKNQSWVKRVEKKQYQNWLNAQYASR
jgi:dTDP-glucose 4,6-dehydratase